MAQEESGERFGGPSPHIRSIVPHVCNYNVNTVLFVTKIVGLREENESMWGKDFFGW